MSETDDTEATALLREVLACPHGGYGGGGQEGGVSFAVSFSLRDRAKAYLARRDKEDDVETVRDYMQRPYLERNLPESKRAYAALDRIEERLEAASDLTGNAERDCAVIFLRKRADNYARIGAGQEANSFNNAADMIFAGEHLK